MNFRDLNSSLRSRTGPSPDWPDVVVPLLDNLFATSRGTGVAYSGEVFKDRRSHQENVPETDGPPATKERVLVKCLYHHCRTENMELLNTPDGPIWLLGFEWPNQGGDAEKGRRADLVGLTDSGSLVVFECKRAEGKDTPLSAVVEGLDYLSHLLIPANIKKITAGLERHRTKFCPPGFESVQLNAEATPVLVVMAPTEYFDRFGRSRRCEGWQQMTNVPTSHVRIQFLSNDFASPNASALPQSEG